MELIRFGTVEAEENLKTWESDFKDNTDIPKEAYVKYLSMCKRFLKSLAPMVDKDTTAGYTAEAASDDEDLLDKIKEELNAYVTRQNVEVLLLKIHTYLQGTITKVFSINTKEQLNQTKNAEEQKMNTNNVNTEERIKELEEALKAAEVKSSIVVNDTSIFDKIPGGIYTAAGLGIIAVYGVYRAGYIRGYSNGKDESATIIIMDERE